MMVFMAMMAMMAMKTLVRNLLPADMENNNIDNNYDITEEIKNNTKI